MSRLFYKEDKLIKRDVPNDSEQKDSTIKDYLEKVAKLIPGEVLAAYLAMIGFTNGITDTTKTVVVWCVFAAGLIFTPLYLNFLADKEKPKAIHLLVSTVAFAVWAYQVTGEKLIGFPYNANIASILLIFFTLISGLIPLKKL